MNKNSLIQNKGKKKYGSLCCNLVIRFLLISLLPLTIISGVIYYKVNNGLLLQAKDHVLTTAQIKQKLVTKWFKDCFIDIKVQASYPKTINLLKNLNGIFNNSNNNLQDYILSNNWNLQVNSTSQDLIEFSQRHHFIGNIFLIDKNGNIIYSLKKKDHLGTNLLHGHFANSQLSSTVNTSLITGNVKFSGLDRYQKDTPNLNSFISAPIISNTDKIIGALVIQLDLKNFFEQLNPTENNNSSLIHYLITGEGDLLSPISSNRTNNLITKIDISPFQNEIIWNRHLEKEHPLYEHAFEYMGPNDKSVIGIHYLIEVDNIKWILVSELETKEALSFVESIGEQLIFMLLFTAILISLLALIAAKRITKPRVELVKISKLVAKGETNHQVKITENNEIGEFASAFNHMLKVLKYNEKKLQISNTKAHEAFADLAEQQFALNQHASVTIADLAGTITYVNKNFIDTVGYNKEELIGQNHRIINSGIHNNAFYQDLYKTIGLGNVWHGEVCCNTKDNRHVWMDTTVVPFKDTLGNTKSFITIRTNISDRKETEDKLTEALKKAEEATLVKSEFLASMSHEIRTPMNGVLGMLGLLLKSDLSQDQQVKANIAQSSAKSLLSLINDILDYSKVDAGKLNLEEIDFDLHSVMSEFIKSMAYQAQTKNLELILNLNDIKQNRVVGDPGRLKQILTNLVGNAIKFTQKGEVVVRCSLVDLNTNGWQFNCMVTDTGIGIPSNKQDRLFNSFSQVDASTTRKYGGTGLGLAIVKKICLLMGGNVSVSSRIGSGSCFAFSLNFKKSQYTQSSPINIKSLNILVVDKNKTNAMMIAEQLEIWGAKITIAEDAREALSLCQKQASDNNFDITIIELQLPTIDGKTLVEKIRQNSRYTEMKLIVMASISEQGNKQYYSKMGFDAYFHKPCTSSDLFDALASVRTDIHSIPSQTEDQYGITLLDSTEPVEPNQNNYNLIKDKRILLVEDNKVNQVVAREILQDANLTVDIAENGIEAINKLAIAKNESPYSLILMDCQMPEMDGYEATKKIRTSVAGAENSNIIIIAMTANAMDGDKEKCLNVGMNDYLSKPINADILLNKINHWLINEELKENELTKKIITTKVDWDKTNLQNSTHFNNGQLHNLLTLFLEQTPKLIKQLHQAINDENYEEIRKQTHAIKGMTANIHAQKLQQQAEYLELAAKEKKSKCLQSNFKTLQHDYSKLKTILSSEIAELTESEEQKESLTKKQLSELMNTLSKKISAGEYIDINKLHFSIKDKNNNLLQNKLNKLSRYVANFETEKALMLIEEITKSNLNAQLGDELNE